jgi:hypothetical protein
MPVSEAANWHEHQGDDAKPRLDPGKVLKMAPARFGEKCAPRTTTKNDRMSPGT